MAYKPFKPEIWKHSGTLLNILAEEMQFSRYKKRVINFVLYIAQMHAIKHATK